MSEFDELFDGSKLPYILSMAKTLSKEECKQIYIYMEKHKPKKILEFGVQFGCSTAVFLQISKWLGLDIELHSWDIIDIVKSDCVSKKDFIFHKEDITGREDQTIVKYNPDMVFLDAHPYYLTKGLMHSCLDRKIDFLCHDVGLQVFNRAKIRSNNFKDKSNSNMAEWELYLMSELIDKSLLKEDFFENEICKVICCRDRFGIAIVEFKNA